VLFDHCPCECAFRLIRNEDRLGIANCSCHEVGGGAYTGDVAQVLVNCEPVGADDT